MEDKRRNQSEVNDAETDGDELDELDEEEPSLPRDDSDEVSAGDSYTDP